VAQILRGQRHTELRLVAQRRVDEDVATPEWRWRAREQMQPQALQRRSKGRAFQCLAKHRLADRCFALLEHGNEHVAVQDTAADPSGRQGEIGDCRAVSAKYAQAAVKEDLQRQTLRRVLDFIFGFKNTRGEVLDHWIYSADGFSVAPGEFYGAVEKRLAARNIPGMTVARQEFAEGGPQADDMTALALCRATSGTEMAE